MSTVLDDRLQDGASNNYHVSIENIPEDERTDGGFGAGEEISVAGSYCQED